MFIEFSVSQNLFTFALINLKNLYLAYISHLVFHAVLLKILEKSLFFFSSASRCLAHDLLSL